MTKNLSADLERDEGRGTRDGNKMGGRGSCRAETAANGDWRLAIGERRAANGDWRAVERQRMASSEWRMVKGEWRLVFLEGRTTALSLKIFGRAVARSFSQKP